MTDLEIPNIVTKIGNYAFFYCNNIKSVSIPNSVTFIGCNAFQYCTYLSNVTIPSSVTSIGNKAFDHCYALKNVTIPNSVTYFGESVFNYCYAISSLMITGDGEWLAGAIDCSPNYLYIDSKITAVHGIKINPKTHVYSYASTPPDCDENSFTNYSGTLHVPATSVAAYFVAEYWSNFGNIVGDAVEPHIKISSDSVEVNLGDQFKLTATITPENACPQTVTWRSTNPTIATVNSNGTVTAVSAGNCDIIVECISLVSTKKS